MAAQAKSGDAKKVEAGKKADGNAPENDDATMEIWSGQYRGEEFVRTLTFKGRRHGVLFYNGVGHATPEQAEILVKNFGYKRADSA